MRLFNDPINIFKQNMEFLVIMIIIYFEFCSVSRKQKTVHLLQYIDTEFLYIRTVERTYVARSQMSLSEVGQWQVLYICRNSISVARAGGRWRMPRKTPPELGAPSPIVSESRWM